MRRASRGWMVCAMASALVVLSTGRAPAQDRESRAKPGNEKSDRVPERASGVIVKAEPVTVGTSSGSSGEKKENSRGGPRQAIRLTINTAAVWRDWARDQATKDAGKESPRQAAERGADSVATRGEPVTKDTTVVIHLDPKSKIETRFRAVDDETSKGSKTPEGAEDRAGSTAKSSDAKSSGGKDKPVKFAASDLRPGLFVEVDFRPMRRGNLASSVAVIRPVGVAAASPAGAGK